MKLRNKSGVSSGVLLFFAIILSILLIWVFMFLIGGMGTKEAPAIIAEIKEVNSYLILDSYLLSEVEEGNIITLINLHDKSRLETQTARIMDKFLENKGRSTDTCWSVHIEYSKGEIIEITKGGCRFYRVHSQQVEKSIWLINQNHATIKITV
ncbi:hypothetical protein ACFLYT_01350 [Nanoarchaeota archaeon]